MNEPMSLGDILKDVLKDLGRMAENLHECGICGCTNTEEELYVNHGKCCGCDTPINLN